MRQRFDLESSLIVDRDSIAQVIAEVGKHRFGELFIIIRARLKVGWKEVEVLNAIEIRLAAVDDCGTLLQ